MPKTEKIILGIDPGTLFMGFGIIQVKPGGLSMILMDTLKLSPKQNAFARLDTIYKKVAELLCAYKPHEFAIEAPFYGKNVQSMLKLGRAQGVAIAAAMNVGIPVMEYSPRKIKQSITGNGNADKEQVLKMLQRILKFDETPQFLDATDALAVAVCHHFQNNHFAESITGQKVSGWKDFLIKNPARVK